MMVNMGEFSSKTTWLQIGGDQKEKMEVPYSII